jgi:nucleoside-diphosphate-sugar epimerase
VAVVRDISKADALAKLGVVLRKGDVTDIESMRAPMTGVDGVFHIAGWYKIGTSDKANGYAVNIEGTRNVLTLMQELKIPKGVYTSTLAVNSSTNRVAVDENYRFDGQHLSVYDETKAKAHEVAKEFIAKGLPLVIVQPGLIYGPSDQGPSRDAIVQMLQRKMPLLPLQTAFAYGHVDDIADAHIAAMQRGRVGESYYVCGPNHTVIESAKIVEKVSGVPAQKLTASPSLMKAMSSFMGLIEKVFPVPPHYTSEFLRVNAGSTYIGKNDKARRELGFNPRPLEEGLRETVLYEMKLLGMSPKT